MNFITKTITQEINGIMGVIFSRQMMMALPILILALVGLILFNTHVDTTLYPNDPIWKVRLK